MQLIWYKIIRSANRRQVVIPRYPNCSFSVRGTTVWNSLPYDLRSTDISLDTFKNKLKTFLFDADNNISAIAALATLGYISVSIIVIIKLICPTAVGHSMGHYYKIGLRLSVSQCVGVSVRLRALSRSHFLIDFHQNWHRCKNPQRKNEFVRGSISHHPFPYFAPQNPLF